VRARISSASSRFLEKIGQIRLSPIPVNKTKEGLTVGDTEQAIVDAYGKGEIVSIPIMAGSVQKATYSNHALHYPGIRWVIGEDGKVTSIFVSED
jgi:hypothetical protein